MDLWYWLTTASTSTATPSPAQGSRGGGGVDGYTEMGINYSILCLGDAEKSTRVELILCCFFFWSTFYRSTHRNSTSRVGAMWHNCTCAVVLVHFRQFKSTRQKKMYDVICISHILIRFSFLLAYIIHIGRICDDQNFVWIVFAACVVCCCSYYCFRSCLYLLFLIFVVEVVGDIYICNC